jgi:hypothetical protein
MPFSFTCPHCLTTTDVEDQFAGQAGNCFSCGQPIQLPAAMIHPSAAIALQLLEEQRRSRWKFLAKSAIGLVLLLALSGLTYLLVTTVGSHFGLLDDGSSGFVKKNLRTIGAAMQAYHDDFGCYPPAYQANQTGKPMHSWRVLLLPYLGKQHLYGRYDFNEPWDGPNNSQLALEMPRVYAGDPQDVFYTQETSFMVITGKGTPFFQDQSCSKSAIGDPLPDTILVAEIESKTVSWMDPTDLDRSTMSFEINGTPGSEIGSQRSSGAYVLTADNQIHLLRHDASPTAVESLITINGGESIRVKDVEK